MDQVLALRPFVPAKDYALSRRFYETLGFHATHADDSVTLLQTGSFSFILQNFYEPSFADNCMIQLLVRDVDAWWRTVDPMAASSSFAVKAPSPPALRSWGLKVGFIFDPSGVLWHVAEVPF